MDVVVVDSILVVEMNSEKKVELKIKEDKSGLKVLELKVNDDVDVLDLIDVVDVEFKVESIELLDRKLVKKEDVIVEVKADEVLKLGFILLFRSDLTDDVDNKVELNEELRVERCKDEEWGGGSLEQKWQGSVDEDEDEDEEEIKLVVVVVIEVIIALINISLVLEEEVVVVKISSVIEDVWPPVDVPINCPIKKFNNIKF